jgi:hypothetical protein
MEKDYKAKITNGLVKKLLAGEIVELSDTQGMVLPKEEHEELRDVVYAKVLEGEVAKVIAICLGKEVIYLDKKTNDRTDDGEIYHTEEMYRLPYSTNKRWLKKGLRKARKQSHSYFMNRV